MAASSSRLPDVALLEAQPAREAAALWARPAAAWRLKELFGFGVEEAQSVLIRSRGREQRWLRDPGDPNRWQRSLPAAPPDPTSTVARHGSSAVADLLQQMRQLRARDFASLPARTGRPILEMRVATTRGAQRLDIVRVGGSSGPLAARVSSSLRDDDASTLFILESDALAPFQTALSVLGL